MFNWWCNLDHTRGTHVFSPFVLNHTKEKGEKAFSLLSSPLLSIWPAPLGIILLFFISLILSFLYPSFSPSLKFFKEDKGRSLEIIKFL